MHSLFAAINLTTVHGLLCMTGALLAVYVMQMTGHKDAELNDSYVLACARRISLWLLGLSLLWAFNYSDVQGWSPWPPDVAVIACIDMTLFIRAITLYRRSQWIKMVRDSNLSSVPIKRTAKG